MKLIIPTNSLESYAKAVVRVPALTLERELELARRLKEENDLEAAQELVLSHLKIVVYVARGFSGYGLPEEDLIQEGSIGLMKAVKMFDASRGVRLAAFAFHYVRGQMYVFIVNNWRLVKFANTKSQRKLFFNLRSLMKGLQPLKPREITDIAEELDVSEKDVIEMESKFANKEIALETDDEDDLPAQPINYLVADPEYEPSRYLERIQLRKLNSVQLAEALKSLDAREHRIIDSRWLCKPEEEATLHDLSLEFNVSKERIRQIEQKALKKMQSNFSDVVTDYVLGD